MKLPETNNRVAVYGPTGSGKTYLCERLLRRYDNVVKIDFKHHLTPRRQDLVANDFRSFVKQLRKQDSSPEREVIYRVPREELLKHNAAALDRIPALIMERGHTVLYYDDVIYVAGATDYQIRAPNFFYALTVGRGKGVGVWSVTQRPALIPVSVHTESDVRITFNLRRLSDRKRVEESFGTDQIPWERLKLQRYSFVIGNDMTLTKPMKLGTLQAA